MKTHRQIHLPAVSSCSVVSLAQARQTQLTAGTQAASGSQNQCYAVLLVDSLAESEPKTGLAKPEERLLYFGRPDHNFLEMVPDGAQGEVLLFTDEFACLSGHERELLLFHLFNQAEHDQPLRVPAEQAAELAFLLTSLKHQAASIGTLRDEILRSYLRTLLLCCTRLQQESGKISVGVQPGLLGRFQQLLEVNYTRWKSVAEYANRLHVTPNHLSVSIRKETGRPASEHIRHRIMLEARRLIARRDAPLKEVAYELGFEDVAHFSKLFKRCTGTTFSAFKQQTQAQYTLPAPTLMVA
ncbi:helix-turn-helix domain-containing protein [Hymenobacter wooponensis]|uniref:AraC family transcriptional regulator n=1 Tax=Hymenobacter wooponensis TaxID=1525360 RepID=A0A4Z0MRU6_9BACT|nr:helix-turn-helix domain-containing protein [Hymenobacter wooponensis]TGD82552.1 AraC family transcriptional regulator [Hymenobacter wooponensis]